MEEYIIRETEDFLALSTLFHESGMGVAIEDRVPERVIKMWRMDDPQTGELMAASTLEMRAGVYSLGDIAVRNDLHCKGYGKVMQNVVFTPPDDAVTVALPAFFAVIFAFFLYFPDAFTDTYFFPFATFHFTVFFALTDTVFDLPGLIV